MRPYALGHLGIKTSQRFSVLYWILNHNWDEGSFYKISLMQVIYLSLQFDGRNL